ncbi:hypothetical protein ASM33_08545 [Wolbachia endosymbiont of Folsomia candida]|nr:hypothetical protein ASM33_08545 [Wolbachia endosymbiont of Folsomia candida]
MEYQKRKVLGGAVIGASTVFALSFAVALSPLVIGGIVGAISGILFAGSSMLWGKSTQDRINFCVSMHSLGAVTGIGLGATANAVFPGVMLSIGPAILAGAVIGAIAPVLGLFAVEKANSYIISPVVEKVTECFSSRKNQSNMTYSWN